jgi:hypothetical protein
MSAKPLLVVLVVSIILVSATPLDHVLGQRVFSLTSFAEVAVLDLFTNKGGSGMNVSGGVFYVGNYIIFYANVTYNGEVVADSLVSYEIRNTVNQALLCSTARSDLHGIAKINFTIPLTPKEEVLGTWTAVATASVAQRFVSDQLTFQVIVDPPLLPGDINLDGRVDIRDATLLCMAWASKIGDANYNPNCDFNKDGEVNIADASILSMNWNQKR